MFARSLFAAAIGAALLAGVASCDPYESVSPAPIVAVTNLKVTPQTVQLSAVGETRQLVASLGPSNATDQRVIWESSDPTIASVDSTGLVTARKIGADVFVTVFTHDRKIQSSANVSVGQ